MDKKTRPSQYTMYYNANQNIQERSVELRKRETNAEKLLWTRIRSKQVAGFKFRRQHPLERFIVDFYCHKAKLVIELDGEIHNIEENAEYDENRTAEIQKYEIKVIRFTNQQIETDIEAVLEEIETELLNRNS